MTVPADRPHPTPSDEVVTLCQELIRIDTTNTGDPATVRPERPAAEWVAARLAEVGVEARLYEPVPGRTSVVARIEGTDPQRGGLLVHGHLDVVPAEPADWSVPPFSGEVRDGYLWGRGAVDMKDFDAMMLAVVRHWRRTGYRPPRDIVLAFTADEEAGGALGAHFLVDRHPELFAGCTEAIGEVGGYSVPVPGDGDRRIYLVQVAEKGMVWLRLRATGAPGHGSMLHEDNAVTALAEAVARLGRHRFPVSVTAPARAMLAELGEALGVAPDRPEELLEALGPAARMLGAALRNTANPTRFTAGYKENVIPGGAWASVDCRPLPGQWETMLAEVRALVGPEVELDYPQCQPAVETAYEGPLVAAMTAALRAEDPGAHPVPYIFSGGTDAKAFSRLGIRCFGFSPLKLPPDLNFPALFHGVDERVPVTGLEFGVRVLDHFLRSC